MPEPPTTDLTQLQGWSTLAQDLAQGLAAKAVHEPDSPATSCYTHRDLLRRDLALTEVTPTLALPTHTLTTVAARAAAIALAVASLPLTGATVIADESAAWVWVGGTPPHRIVINSHERLRTPGWIHPRQVVLRPYDVRDAGGCPVMTPARAFSELVGRRSHPYAPEFATRLVVQGWVTPEEFRKKATAIRVRRLKEKKARAAAAEQGIVLPPQQGSDGPKAWTAVRYRALAKAADALLENYGPYIECIGTPSDVTRYAS